MPALLVPDASVLVKWALRSDDEPDHDCALALKALMRTHKVTFYDAAYHALAMHVGGTMLTADDAYVRKAGRAGHVRRLADWGSGSTG